MKFLQRIAYLNVAIYPFTSIFLFLYCLVPALSLLTHQFIVEKLSMPFLVYLLALSITLCTVAGLEIKWSGITLKEWWQTEQMWLIGGTSAHLFAVFQGMLKVILGIEIKLPVKNELPADDEEEFADLYLVKLTPLMIPPIIIMLVNVIAIAVGVSRAIYGSHTNWGQVLCGVLLSFWVLSHYLPFIKGLMGRRGRTPALVYIWAGLISITIALLIIAIDPPPNFKSQIGGPFSLTWGYNWLFIYIYFFLSFPFPQGCCYLFFVLVCLYRMMISNYPKIRSLLLISGIPILCYGEGQEFIVLVKLCKFNYFSNYLIDLLWLVPWR